jgi:Rod binding domain-containing protein
MPGAINFPDQSAVRVANSERSNSVSPTRDTNAERERVQKAARDFEALLVAQMLKSAREGSSGAFSGTESDQATESILEMGEQQIANLLAASGGLGLSTLLVSGLSKQSEGDPIDPQTTPSEATFATKTPVTPED